MSLHGLSPTAWWLGLGLLGAAVFALHLLRVRLRAVDVDTLLFFRLAGAVQKPRVLPGRPSRWLSLLLALLGAALAWTAYAEPRSGQQAPSRFVVVEPAGPGLLPERLALGATLAGEGLGPRGAVLAATSPPVVLLDAHEPLAALALRADGLAAADSPLGAAQALAAVRDRLQPGDQVLWLGSTPPPAGSEALHVPPPRAVGAMLRGLAWQRSEAGELVLVVQLDGGLATGLELLGPDGALAHAEAAAGQATARLGPCTVTAGPLRLRLVQGAAAGELAVPLPAVEPLRVLVEGDLPGDLPRSLAAVLAADAELAPAPDAAHADVVVATADADSDLPRLVLLPGIGDGARLPQLAAGSPVPLSLRDRQRRAASALPPMPEANVWVQDLAQGAPLVAGANLGGHLRVFAVDWLLQPCTHADVPALLAFALRELGGRPRAVLAAAGQPLALPAAFGPAIAPGAVRVLPTAGALHLVFADAGTRTVDTTAGPRLVHVLAAEAPGTVAVPPAPGPSPPATAGGLGAWMPWLLLLLVLLLAADAVLFHRGRLP